MDSFNRQFCYAAHTSFLGGTYQLISRHIPVRWVAHTSSVDMHRFLSISVSGSASINQSACPIKPDLALLNEEPTRHIHQIKMSVSGSSQVSSAYLQHPSAISQRVCQSEDCHASLWQAAL